MSWRQLQLAQFIDSDGIDLQTGPFGTQLRASDYTPDGTPVINVRNVGYGGLRPEKLEFVPEQVASRLSKHLLEPKDIVFGRKGAVDRHLLVSESEAGWMQGSDCIRLRVRTVEINPEFLSFALRLPGHKKWMITQCSNKATMASLNQDVIARIPISLPDPATQAEIASILSTYDDLIENNRRRIQLLEQAARLLYREWFVHLRFPGHEHVTITDGVPDGWEEMTVADVCTSFEDGDWIETKDQGGSDFRLLQISNIGQNEFVETGNYRYITADTFRRLRCNEVAPGDILIARMPKPIGRAWYVYEQPWRMVTAVDVTIARPNSEAVDSFYLLHHLNSPMHIARCEMKATGATRPRVTRRNIGALPILKPPMSLQHLFGEIASAVGDQRNVLTRQNQQLTNARDLLLPRLMNGELAV